MLVVNGVSFDQFVELFPEVDILDFTGFLSPAIFLPAFHPGLHALQDIRAVRKQCDVAGFLQCFESFDDGRQFHAVVGCFRLACGAFQFLSRLVAPEDKPPTAWSRISAACSVGK